MEYREWEKEVLNPYTEIHYAMLSSFSGRKFPHSHDFFEITLILEGEQDFITTSNRYILRPGSLMLVRPGDIHSRIYTQAGCHINMAFSHEIMDALFSYLGPGFPFEEIMSAPEPSMVLLSSAEKDSVKNMLEEVSSTNITNTAQIKTRLRILIMNIMVKYFANSIIFSAKAEDNWLTNLLHEIEVNKNFMDGVERMVELSGRSHEHLCRIFKTELHCTPTDYINKLKLNYAANQLIHTDIDIFNICMNIGFSNLSYFYQIFKNAYQLSPAKFRKKYQQSHIPDSSICF